MSEGRAQGCRPSDRGCWSGLRRPSCLLGVWGALPSWSPPQAGGQQWAPTGRAGRDAWESPGAACLSGGWSALGLLGPPLSRNHPSTPEHPVLRDVLGFSCFFFFSLQ